MCNRGNSSPAFISNIWNVACTQLQFKSTESCRSRFYLSLSFRDFQPPTYAHPWKEPLLRTFVLSLGEVLHWKILICIEPTVYPQTDFKRSGGWKTESTDWCFLRGVRQNRGFNCSNERNASTSKEWRVFVFFLDRLLFVCWPDTLWENPFKTQFESWLLGFGHFKDHQADTHYINKKKWQNLRSN